MKKLKIAIIGAGSTYTPELIEGIINKKEDLKVSELFLMDIDERKLDIVGGLCKRMIETSGLNTFVELTLDLNKALKNADFVLCQIRVGKLAARLLDEKIPLKYNLIGQETNGIGGFFKGMRTIPVMMDITKRMEKLCPNAWLINFSNPSGMIAEAILNNSKIKMLGLCNVPINMVDSIKRRLKLDEAKVEYVGLNHFSYITSIVHDNKDYLQTAIKEGINSEAMKNIPAYGFPKELIRTLQAIPSSYLEYYYYKDSKLEKAKFAQKSRAEVCMEIEEDLLKQYQDSNLHVKPELLSKRGGARYSEVAINLVDAIVNDRRNIQIVNTRNNGAIKCLDNNNAVEVCAIIGKNGAEVIPTTYVNEHIDELFRLMKAYEVHSVRAALTGDKDEALRALLVNPLIWDYNSASKCFEEMLELNKIYLPQFKVGE